MSIHIAWVIKSVAAAYRRNQCTDSEKVVHVVVIPPAILVTSIAVVSFEYMDIRQP
jgi:hypothetical protein